MIERLQRLADDLSALPDTRTELQAFPSGAALLDVWRANRFFVLAYMPKENLFGVDEVHDDEGFLWKFDFVTPDFEAAAARLMEIVTETMVVSSDRTGAPTNGFPIIPKQTPTP